MQLKKASRVLLLLAFGVTLAGFVIVLIMAQTNIHSFTTQSPYLTINPSQATSSLTPTPTRTAPVQTITPILGGNLVKIVYSASNEDFANPERGFMKQSSIYVDQPLDASKIRVLQPTDTVVWVYFRLDNYRDPRDGYGVKLCDPLGSPCPGYQGKLLEPVGSGKGLDTVKATFSTARSKGLKLIIRFIYNPGPGSSSNPLQVNPDVPLELALQHINQLKDLIHENKDLIVAVQIGFVGHWGEWHSSKYMEDLMPRKAIIDSILAAVPKDRMLMIRYPRYKQIWYGGILTESNAFNQSDVARIGFHDDAFLRDENDGGTFKSTISGTKITNYCDGYSDGEIACWRDYVSKDTRFLPVGGEAGTHSSTPSQFADCSNALIQLNNMHWSFLNNGYSKVVLDHWVNQGCMPEIRRRLGYRFELIDANITKTTKPGGMLNLNISLRNVGFASMFNPRPVILVLQGPSNRYEFPLNNVDPRRWSAGQDHRITANLTLPSTVVTGVYTLALWLPDQATMLRNNPSYAVRFANSNVWDTTSGVNILTSNFEIIHK